MADGELGDGGGRVQLAIEIEAELIFHHRPNPGGGAAAGEPFLGLAGELGLADFDGQHILHVLPNVLGGQFDMTRQQLMNLAELAQGLHQPAAQAIDVGAAQGRGNEIGEGLGHGAAAFRLPDQSQLDFALLVAVMQQIGQLRQTGAGAELFAEVGAEALVIVPVLAVAAELVVKVDVQAGAEHGLGPQRFGQAGQVEAGLDKIVFVHPEAHLGAAGVGFRHRPERLHHRAAGTGQGEALAVAPDGNFQAPGQGIDHGNADAVQAAAELVVLAVEFAAGVEPGQDKFDGGNALLGVNVGGNAPAVVAHRQGAVGVEPHVNFRAEAGQGLIDGVVDDLLGQMVGAAGVGVHIRPDFHRVQAAQYHHLLGGVGFFHGNFLANKGGHCSEALRFKRPERSASFLTGPAGIKFPVQN